MKRKLFSMLLLALSSHCIATNEAVTKTTSLVKKLNAYNQHLSSLFSTTSRYLIVEKLAQLRLAENDNEFWQLFALADQHNFVATSHGLAREYLQKWSDALTDLSANNKIAQCQSNVKISGFRQHENFRLVFLHSYLLKLNG
jgi:hypothetical protein